VSVHVTALSGRQGRITVVTSDAHRPDLPDDSTGPDVPVNAEGIAAAQRSLRVLEVLREVERYVAGDGWDQNPRLFALARTVDLVALEPELAEALGSEGEDPNSLTPIEQELTDPERPLDELLATLLWPEEVVGAALVLERLMLPPSAEETLPDHDPHSLEDLAATHPDRQDVRMAVVVLRAGDRMCALRLRSHDSDAEVLTGDALVPRLADALAATFS
jgi:hypothetical protein